MGRKSSIYLGQKFGKLIVKEIIPANQSGKHVKVKCNCECGKETIVSSHLLKNKIKSCGCNQKYYRNLTGKTFGKIFVVSLLKENSEFDNHQGHLYLCECLDCKSQYKYQASSILRESFLGCRCDITSSGAKNKTFESYKKNAKDKKRKFELTFDNFVKICEQKCHYCDKSWSNESRTSKLNSWKYNGIDRLNNNMGYEINNCVPCCKICNKMKCNLSEKEFFSHIQEILFKHFPNIAEALKETA